MCRELCRALSAGIKKLMHADACHWPPPLMVWPRPMQIPLVMYLMTHAYFCFYHALSNVLLRRVRGAASMMTIMLW